MEKMADRGNLYLNFHLKRTTRGNFRAEVLQVCLTRADKSNTPGTVQHIASFRKEENMPEGKNPRKYALLRDAIKKDHFTTTAQVLNNVAVRTGLMRKYIGWFVIKNYDRGDLDDMKKRIVTWCRERGQAAFNKQSTSSVHPFFRPVLTVTGGVVSIDQGLINALDLKGFEATV
jgi:hypothetical protein